MIEILKKYLRERFRHGNGGPVFFKDGWWNFSLIAHRALKAVIG